MNPSRFGTAGLFVVVVLIALLTFVKAIPGDKTVTPAAKLIENLDHDDFETREEASQLLMNRPDAMAAIIIAARYSSSPEVRHRCSQILDVWRPKIVKNKVKRLVEKIKEGEIDWAIDRMVRMPSYVDESVWQALSELADRLRGKANRLANKTISLPALFALEEPVDPTEVRNLDHDKELRHRKVLTTGLSGRIGTIECLVASRGSVWCINRISDSVVFVNGQVRVGGTEKGGIGTIHDGMVFCDGSIETDDAARCILIATGSIKIHGANDGNVIAIENTCQALGILHPFELREVGIQAELVQGKVKVTKVSPMTALAQAGVQAGDLIEALDGQKVTEIETLRRDLRLAFATKDAVLFTVIRGDKSIKIPVAILD